MKKFKIKNGGRASCVPDFSSFIFHF